MIVYFLIYAGAVEEQAYLTTLRRERSAFEFLISEKSVRKILLSKNIYAKRHAVEIINRKTCVRSETYAIKKRAKF